MKIGEPKCELFDDSKLQIHDSNELSAKKLFALFMASYGTIEDIMKKSEEVKAIEAICDIMDKCGLDIDLVDKAQSLPWIVCHSFYDFLAESPHVHITID